MEPISHPTFHPIWSVRMLVADSDVFFNHRLANRLRDQGYGVEQCFDDQSTLERVREPALDLILLDSDLPRRGGWPLLAELRGVTPIILLSEHRSSCVDAFRQGADDFVAKPCDPLELVVRSEALLRRVRGGLAPETAPNELIVGPLVLSRVDRSALFGALDLTLTAVQFKLLWHLAWHHNELLSKPYLHERVLEKSYCRDDRSIDMHLSRIRKKLLGAGMLPDALQTIRGRGYRLALMAHSEPRENA